MARGSREWIEFDAWNEALVHEMLSDSNDGVPVYLTAEDSVLEAVRQRRGREGGGLVSSLESAVAQTVKPGDTDPFRVHRVRAERWRSKDERRSGHGGSDSPPFVALLTLFTLAADKMGSKRDISPNAYYPILAEMLGWERSADRNRLSKSFRDNTEQIWKIYNYWLDSRDGRYGLPTAYALGFRFVGLPVSQALLRKSDRAAFPHLFSEYGLPPGTDLPASDIEPLLGEWISNSSIHVPKRLKDLWSRAAARPRLAELVATELLQWDGSGVTQRVRGGVAAAGRVFLCLNVNRIPNERLEATVLATFIGSSPPETVIVETLNGSAEIDVIPVSGRRVRPRGAVPFDLNSLLLGTLTVATADTSPPSIRMPRRVLPLRYDALLGAYVECDQVSLGEEYMLLIKDDEALVQAVKSVVSQNCRPGFKAPRGLPGVPEGWVLVRHVQFMTPFVEAKLADLAPLVPLIRTKLTVDGGFRFPGRVTRWSSSVPPEIRVASEAENVTVVLVSDSAPQTERTWTLENGFGVIETHDLKLADGDYTVTLSAEGKELQRTGLRLRSGDTYDVSAWERSPRLLHDMRDPLQSMTAREGDENGPAVVDGVWASESHSGGDSGLFTKSSVPWWGNVASERAEPEKLMIEAAASGTCFYTGAHRYELPPTPARIQSRRELVGQFSTAYCGGCGMVKRFPKFLSFKSTGLDGHGSATRDVGDKTSNMPPAGQSRVTWEAALDGLVHAGGGSASALRAMASQVEGTALFLDNFTRALESLGHIEVERNDRFDVVRWEIARQALADTPTRGLVLCGSWTAGNRASLASAVSAVGGVLTSEQAGEGLRCDRVEGLSVEDVEALDFDGRENTTLVPAAAESIARLLPNLSAVEDALPRMPMPAAAQIRRFESANARWIVEDSIKRTGAYRLSFRHSIVDVFVNEVDLSKRHVARCSVHLGKHLSAKAEGRVLLSYDRTNGALTVPLGCDLPGLFGRAAVLASGLPPKRTGSRSLVYWGVPPLVAQKLQNSFTN